MNRIRHNNARGGTARCLLLVLGVLAFAACDQDPTEPTGVGAGAPELGRGLPQAPSYRGDILFVSQVDDVFLDIFRADSAGGSAVRLTQRMLDNFGPVWSPDYTKIAFTSTRGPASSRVFVMNGDGSGQVAVATPPPGFNDRWTAWSPDGKQIAFVRYSAAGPADLYAVTLKNGQVRRITKLEDGSITRPHWSPDGTRIVFTRKDPVTDVPNIFSVNADGRAVKQLTHCAEPCRDGQYSPNGSRIVLSSDTHSLALIPASGGTPDVIFRAHPEGVWHPSFSPDGESIVFQMNSGNTFLAMKVRSNGQGGAWLATGLPNELQTSWSR